MGCRATREWLDAVCANNPAICYSVQGGKKTDARHGKREVKAKEKPAANKYRNKKMYRYSTGIVCEQKEPRLGEIINVYGSVKEYKRHEELLLLLAAGEISELETQKPLVIQEGFTASDGTRILPITYVADFAYKRNGQMVIEDVKGFDRKTGKHLTTKDFRLKWKLLQYKYRDYKFLIV